MRVRGNFGGLSFTPCVPGCWYTAAAVVQVVTHGGLGIITAGVFLAGEMAGSGVLALPFAMVGTGDYSSVTNNILDETWSSVCYVYILVCVCVSWMKTTIYISWKLPIDLILHHKFIHKSFMLRKLNLNDNVFVSLRYIFLEILFSWPNLKCHKVRR